MSKLKLPRKGTRRWAVLVQLFDDRVWDRQTRWAAAKSTYDNKSPAYDHGLNSPRTYSDMEVGRLLRKWADRVARGRYVLKDEWFRAMGAPTGHEGPKPGPDEHCFNCVQRYGDHYGARWPGPTDCPIVEREGTRTCFKREKDPTKRRYWSRVPGAYLSIQRAGGRFVQGYRVRYTGGYGHFNQSPAVPVGTAFTVAGRFDKVWGDGGNRYLQLELTSEFVAKHPNVRPGGHDDHSFELVEDGPELESTDEELRAEFGKNPDEVIAEHQKTRTPAMDDRCGTCGETWGCHFGDAKSESDCPVMDLRRAPKGERRYWTDPKPVLTPLDDAETTEEMYKNWVKDLEVEIARLRVENEDLKLVNRNMLRVNLERQERIEELEGELEDSDSYGF